MFPVASKQGAFANMSGQSSGFASATNGPRSCNVSDKLMPAMIGREQRDTVGRSRHRKLRSSSAFALAACLLAPAMSPAAAQSFQADPTIVSGTAQISTTSGATTVNVSTARTVIDWTVSDQQSGSIAFQSAGTTARFIAGTGLGNDFAVLNRIIAADPSRAARFDGIVNAAYQTSTGLRTGGTILFFSPGGILLGPSASFDVGSLVLTSANPVIAANGDFLATNALGETSLQVTGAAAASRISIEAGASVRTTGYVAIIAPAIANAGTISLGNRGGNAAGAALVAAESASLVFRPSGLFDIEVDLGTSADGAVIANSGSIVGTAASAANRNNRIYLIAMSRNAAASMAMTAGSRLGFDVAASARQDGNAVVLSGGSAIRNGTVASAASSNSASLDLQDATFLSGLKIGSIQDMAVSGTTTVAGSLTASIAGTFSTSGTLAATGDLGIHAGSITAASITSGKDLELRALNTIAVDTAIGGDDLLIESAQGNIVANMISATGDFANDSNGADVVLSALSGGITLGKALAGDDINLRAGTGGLIAKSLTTTGRRSDAERTEISLTSRGNLTLGEATSLASIALLADRVEARSLTAAEDILVSAGSDIKLGTVRAGDDVMLNAAGSLRADTLVTTGIGPDDRSLTQAADGTIEYSASDVARANLLVNAGLDVSLGSATTRGSMVLGARALSATSLVSGEDISVNLSGNGTIATLQSADDIVLQGSGALAIETIRTTGIGPDDRSIVPGAVLAFASERFERANVLLDVAGDLSATAISARGSIGVAGLSVSGGDWNAGEDLVVTTTGRIALGRLLAADDLLLSSSGNISATRLETTGIGPDNRALNYIGAGFAVADVRGDRANIIVDSLADVTLGDTSARASLAVRGTQISGGDWTAGEDMSVLARGTANLGSLAVGDDLTVRAGQDLFIGTVSATSVRENDRSIVVDAISPITFAGETSNDLPLPTGFSALARDGFTPAGASLVARGTVTLVAGRNVTSQKVSANAGIAMFAGGNLQALDVTSTSGTIGIGAIGSSTRLGNVTATAMPVALVSGGNLSAGSVAGSSLLLDAGATILAGSVTASEQIRAVASGTISISGQWKSPFISLRAGDLDLNTMASGPNLDAGIGGSIEIVAASSGPLVVGNATDDGFHLDQNELGSIRAKLVQLSVAQKAGRPADIIVSNLALSAPAFAVPGGILALSVLGPNNDGTPSGRILVNGDLAISGIPDDFTLRLTARTIDIEAPGGSLSLSGEQGRPTGTLQVDTTALRATTSDVLSAIPASSSTAGLMRTLSVPLDLGKNAISAGAVGGTISESFLVQNTGTASQPLGILVRPGGLSGLDTRTGIPLVLLNGPNVDGSNMSLRDNLQSTNPALISGMSSANGCLLVLASCTAQSVLAQEQTVQSLANAQSQVTAFVSASPGPFAPSLSQETILAVNGDPLAEAMGSAPSSQAPEEQLREAAAASPIAPPSPVINLVDVTSPEPVRTLVTGSGNPALVVSDGVDGM